MKSPPGLVGFIICTVVSVLTGADSRAQGYPAKPIRLIVPYAVGGGVDTMARLVVPRLSEGLGQQVVIDNRGGAGGNIGFELAAKAAPNGYTVLMVGATFAINVSLYGKVNFDPLKDFTAVTLLAKSPNILAVHPSLPVKSVKELIALARSRPGQINYASGGSGSTPHLAAELFKTMAKINLVHVPYKSTSPALIALLSGEASLIMAPALVVLPHVATGKLRALAITSTTRSAALPELPTIGESGLPGYEVVQWFGVLVPAGTPDTVVSRLSSELVKIIQLRGLSEQLDRQGSIPVGSTPQQFAAYLREEVQKWAKVVKQSGARVE